MDTEFSIHLSTVFLSGILDSAGPLVLVLLLLVCSALVSGSEVALFSLTPAQRAELKESKDSYSQNILRLLEKPNKKSGPKKLLATILIVNNAVNIALIIVSTSLMERWVPPDVQPSWLAIVLNVVVVTFIIVLFGEVVPKVYATGNNLKTARFMAAPLIVIQTVCHPLSWLLIRTSGFLEDALRKKTSGNISVDELGHALELTTDENRSQEEHKILEGIVTFGAKEVRQIMTPRTDIAALWISDTSSEVMETVLEKGYSRWPVYRDSADEIVGFIFVKDLLPYIDEIDFDWQKLIRQPFFVPENKKIDDLLQQFQKEKIHLAIVVDEYGGTLGLVTLEDILEEIVGDISDEFDDEELRYSKLDETTYVVEAKISLVDMYKVMGIDGDRFEESRGDSSTLAGFLIEQAGRIPDKGETIAFEGFRFTIEAADKRKIKRVKVSLPVAEMNNGENDSNG
ncbi:MAG: gliding motility-associated protein GldE [Crocinitomicaceae bacterium]|nr:gliding motility-associated protein GldE [Crocinitomicaceae bacterium]